MHNTYLISRQTLLIVKKITFKLNKKQYLLVFADGYLYSKNNFKT